MTKLLSRILTISLLVLLFLPQFTFGYKYDLSICAIFQNEAEWLREWIEYHRIVGVEHFWLYNNNSTDHYKDILAPYIRRGIVELIDWPSPQDEDWTPYQNSAYDDSLKRARRATKWLAAIDVDEFIVPKSASTIPEILARFEKNRKVGGVMLFWQFFGTSHVWEIPANQTMIETLLMKAPVNYEGNHQVKTICRPDRVKNQYVHVCTYLDPYYDVTMNGAGGPNQPIQIDQICIHHYWTKTEKYFREVKCPRRERYERRGYAEHELQKFQLELNQELDTSILRYVPYVKWRLGMK